jgi:hypothetical protein
VNTEQGAIKMKRIKVEFSEDRMGCLHLRPVNERLQGRIKRYLAEWKVGWDGDVLIQEDYNAEATLREHLTGPEREQVRLGWSVTKLMDPWTFLHYVGWDAHEGVAC